MATRPSGTIRETHCVEALLTQPIRAIFYDAGFTLIEPTKSIAQICGEALLRRGHPAEAAALEQVIPPFDPFLEERQQDGELVFASDARVTEVWHEYYRTLFRRVVNVDKLDDSELHACAVEVTDLYRQADHWRPYPEVPATLAEGRRRGLVQGVISDWGSNLVPILHGLNLSDLLDFVVVSAVVQAAKPNGHLFELALRRSGIPREAILFVGDNYRLDVIGGRGAGFSPVLIDRYGRANGVDCPTIDRLDQLFDLIDRASVSGISATTP